MGQRAEAWSITEVVRRMKANGANSQMLSATTGKTQREEATEVTSTFNLLCAVARSYPAALRLGEDRLLQKAVKTMYEN